MSQKDRDYSEKRDFIRMPVECTVRLLDGERQIQGKCLDLSSTGMQVVAATSLNAGDRLRVLIASQHLTLKGLDAETEVIRVATLEDGQQSLGLAILAMA